MYDFFQLQYAARFYFSVALFSTLLFVLKLFVFCDDDFGGEDGIGDSSSHSDSDDAFAFLSLQSILAFLMGFGWSGLAGAREWKLGAALSFAVALGFGCLFMFISAFLMSKLKKLNEINVVDLRECIDRIGKSYTRFSPKSAGQIQIEINGRLATVGAVNNSADEIKSFDIIKVVRVENDVLYIEKITEEGE
jgi:membrane-bound ClpP family serine protease